jgi:hypothetical protein
MCPLGGEGGARSALTDRRRRVQAYGPHAEFSAESGSPDRVDFSRVEPDVTKWPPQLRSSFRPFARSDGPAQALTTEDAASYRSYVCKGEARIQSGDDWDPKVSVLLPDDGLAPGPAL